jgi:Ca-activated chloride channel homolog
VDVSDSMEASDVAPNRLAAAEAAANAFLDQLPPDFRVGLATFAGEARLAVAPTQARNEVVNALGALTTSRGTVIGDGLSVALDTIEEVREGGDAVAVLLSDGRDTGSAVPPREAAERASELGVPVFTILLGQVTDEGAGANLAAMEEIATTSGGESFTAETANDLTSRFENLGSELNVNLDVEPSTKPLVIAAIALAVLAGLMLIILPR